MHIASTRNPNQVFDLLPVAGRLTRRDIKGKGLVGNPLVPIRSRFYPGCLYLHDLAMIEGDLYANAVGENTVVLLCESGGYQRAWCPRCIEDGRGFEQNYIQLNSIAAGSNLETSYFSASGERPSRRRPGHQNYPVNRRGVIFPERRENPWRVA